MHFSSAQDLASYLKFLGCERIRQNILLRNLWKDTLASNTLKERLFQGMPEELWFTGLDGRKVNIPGIDIGERRHLAMSGYLRTERKNNNV